MAQRRVLFFGLDGYDPEIGAILIGQGKLPTLARLLGSGLRYDLEHGPAKRTGMAWEHMASGLNPEASGRHAAVRLDTRRYRCRQWPTESQPFTASLNAPVLVYNAPYFDLSRSPGAQGIVGWGTHDPGMPATSLPDDLLREAKDRFGEYPSHAWTYSFVWPSPERTKRMGERLVAGIEHHCRVARWLFAERFTDWRLGYLVCCEAHSADEAMMHGMLPGHLLAGHASAPAARQALTACYEALDRFVATMEAALPDVTLALTVPHGMGNNFGDVPGMLLLAELMHREFAGRPVFRAPKAWQESEVPQLPEDTRDWNNEMRLHCQLPRPRRRPWDQLRSRLERSKLGRRLGLGPADVRKAGWSVDWMPCSWYQESWPQMDAFAIPAYYDGQVRVNLAGREARGRVPLAGYRDVLERIERAMADCRDWRSGKPVAVQATRRNEADPMAIGPTDSDVIFDFEEVTLGWRHPRHGLIGPVPMRRVAGHTGGHGLLLVAGPGIAAGHGGVASTFDVPPTIVSLLGLPVPPGLSGRSLLLQQAA